MVLPPDQNLDGDIAEAVAKETELGKQTAEVAETEEGDVEDAVLAAGGVKSPSEESSSATRSILDYTEVKGRRAETRERKVQKREVYMVRWFCPRTSPWKLLLLTWNIVSTVQKWSTRGIRTSQVQFIQNRRETLYQEYFSAFEALVAQNIVEDGRLYVRTAEN